MPRLRATLTAALLLAAINSAPLRVSGQVSQPSSLGISHSAIAPPPGAPKGASGPVSALQAIRQARKKVRTHPRSAKAYLELGTAFWSAGINHEAGAAITQALKLNPHLAEAWYYDGLIKSGQDNWAAAAKSFQKAVSIKPDYLLARLQLGEALLRQGDFGGAKSQWTWIADKDAANPEARYGLGLIALRQGRMQQAESEFRKAIRLRGGRGYPEASEKLGETLLRQQRWQAAASIFRKVLARQPGSVAAISGLATALGRLGEKDASRKEFSKAQAILRENLLLQRAQGDNNRGLQLWMAGDTVQAADYFRRAIGEDPTYAEPHNNLGGVLWQRNDRKGAIAEFKAAISAQPDFAQAHNNLGSALLQTGDTNGSIPEFRRALALAPGLVMAHFNLAIALSDRDMTNEAEKQFRQVLQLKPDMAVAHVRLGILLASRTGRVSGEARSELREGLRRNPTLARIVPAAILKELRSPYARSHQ